jgi:hypothetical protein
MFELWHRNFLEKFVKPAGLFSLPVVADSRRKVPSAPLIRSSTGARECGADTPVRVPGA